MTRNFPRLMGIVNVTDDSFSDGGQYLSAQNIRERVAELKAGGAHILDIGVESSNPAGVDVPDEEQIGRIQMAVPIAIENGLKVSVDSYKKEVVQAALAEGATIVNDIAGLSDPALCEYLAGQSCEIIPMFNRDFTSPRAVAGGEDSDKTLASLTESNIIDTINRYFEALLVKVAEYGIAESRLILDPGMGFFLGPDMALSFRVLRELEKLRHFGLPLCVSVSRKSFLGALVGKKNPSERGAATLACEMYLAEQNVEYIRTHDVGALWDALQVAEHLKQK